MRTWMGFISAGLIANLVAFSSSLALVYKAANSVAGATPELTSSWLFAVCLGSGVSTLLLSLYYRQPILTAWSTPGAALLISCLNGISPAEAVGAFMVSSLLMCVLGMTGWFEKIMHRIPVSLAAAMLAGILLQFGLKVFTELPHHPLIFLTMLMVYLITKRIVPRHSILLVLCAGAFVSMQQGLLQPMTSDLHLTAPLWVWPQFHASVLVGVAVPLFIVTMASQNLPGIAVMQTHGYRAPVSNALTTIGVINLVLAPFGCFAINLAAITAAICMGKDVHHLPAQRYKSAVMAGVGYIVCAVLGSFIIGLFMILPNEVVLCLAGIALFGVIGSSLSQALKHEGEREAALFSFLVTASGISIGGISSAFWGILAGLIVMVSCKKYSPPVIEH